MSIVDAIILGLIQGLTEFIPVSSSGHLILADELTAIDSSFSFDVLLNIGTLTALIVYFWPRLMTMATNLRHSRGHLVRSLFYSTLPVIVVGGLFIGWFESEALRSGWVVATMLVTVGLVMISLNKLATKPTQNLDNLPFGSALLIGLGQVFALIPGTSRSGSTIITGRLLGLSYKDAAEYSFLLAIPVIAGAVARSWFEPETAWLWQYHTGSVIIGVMTAYFSGIIAIHFMLSWLSRNGLEKFGFYRIVLGVLVILTMVI